jgi:hypothetical protein
MMYSCGWRRRRALPSRQSKNPGRDYLQHWRCEPRLTSQNTNGINAQASPYSDNDEVSRRLTSEKTDRIGV